LRVHADPAALGALLIAAALVWLDLAGIAIAAASVVAVAATRLEHRWWIAGLAVAWIGVSLPGYMQPRLELLVPIVTVAAAATVAVGRDRVSPELIAAMTSMTALGVFAAVPDTEQAVLVASATVVLAAGSLLGGASVHTGVGTAAGALPLVLVVWAGGVGARGRPASFAGVTAAIGLLWLVGLWPRWCRTWSTRMVLAVHAVVVLVASRGAGILRSESTAWTVAAGVLAVVAAIGIVGRRLPVRAARSVPRPD
jgi:hypothetical protein